MKHFTGKLFASLCGAAASTLLFIGAANAALTAPGDVSNAPASAGGQNEVSPELKAAFDDFTNMKFDDAVAKLDKIRENDKDMAPAQLILATWLARIQPAQPQAVRQAIEVGVTKNPADPEAYVILAELNLQNSCVTEAEALFDKGAILNSSFSESAKRKEEIQKRILLGQAQVLALRGKNDQAIERLNSVLKADEKNIGALNLLGLINFNSENYDATLDAYTKARAIQPNLLVPEARLAMMCQQKNTDESKELAKKYMVEAVKKYESDPQTRIVAAQWSLATSKPSSAGKQADYAITLLDRKKTENPNDDFVNNLYSEANLLRGVIALYEKNYTEAEKYFNVVLAESPSNFAATNNLALALCEQNDTTKLNKAVEYAQVNVDRFGKQQPEVFSTAAWVMHKKGQYQDCAQLLQRYLQMTNGQMSPDTAFYLAANMEKQLDSITDAEQKANAKKQALEIITKTLASPNPFVMRPEAEALKERLSK